MAGYNIYLRQRKLIVTSYKFLRPLQEFYRSTASWLMGDPQLKVLKLIIIPNPITVMDLFSREQGPTNSLCHNPSVLQLVLTPESTLNVPIFIRSARASKNILLATIGVTMRLNSTIVLAAHSIKSSGSAATLNRAVGWGSASQAHSWPKSNIHVPVGIPTVVMHRTQSPRAILRRLLAFINRTNFNHAISIAQGA